MTTSDLAISIAAHVQHILDLKESRATAVQRRSDAHREWETAKAELVDVDQQLSTAKAVLDHCIATGEDPIAVRLSMKKSELAQPDQPKSGEDDHLDHIIDHISKSQRQHSWINSILDQHLKIEKTW